MKITFFLLTLFISLYGVNPHVYTPLGDTVYDNALKIAKLKKLQEYVPFKKKIDIYLDKVAKVKKLGFAIKKGEKKSQTKAYLKQLRSLARTNDFFIRNAEAIFRKSLEKNYYNTVLELLDTGLIDVDRNEKDILNFYERNKGNFIPRGEIAKIVKKNVVDKKVYQRRLKKIEEQENIRRMRENDRKRQQRIQKKLKEEIK